MRSLHDSCVQANKEPGTIMTCMQAKILAASCAACKQRSWRDKVNANTLVAAQTFFHQCALAVCRLSEVVKLKAKPVSGWLVSS